MGIKLFKKSYLILIVIILFGLFLRSYDYEHRFIYSHDADLYSWIIKDVVVNHHIRLIGQLTSSAGIFIGSLYYYLLVPFFVLASLDPIGAYFLNLFISVFTILSFYYVFKKLFDSPTGLIAACLHAVLLSRVAFDVWPVPTVLISIWAVWFFYCLVLILKGNKYGYWLLALLISLIWHISFTLAPYLLTVPFAIGLSKKRPQVKIIVQAIGILLITSLPLILFEVRHGFSQTEAFITSFVIDQGGQTGLDKFWHTINKIGDNTTNLFFNTHSSLIEYFHLNTWINWSQWEPTFQKIPGVYAYPGKEALFTRIVVMIVLSLGMIFLMVKQVLERKLVFLMVLWFLSSIIYFTFNTKIITEYYFEGLNILFFAIVTVLLGYLYSQKVLKYLVVLGLVGLCWYSFSQIVYAQAGKISGGYFEKKALVEFIARDARQKDYSCISISYAINPGDIIGTRYFLYLNKVKVIDQNKDIPNYTVVFPLSLMPEAANNRFGPMGVILPRGEFKPDSLKEKCSVPDKNTTDSMFGYTE